MPLLSTYLGHVDPASTYWYLQPPRSCWPWPRDRLDSALRRCAVDDARSHPTLQAFFTDRLITQRQASPHTIAAYRDTFRLLLGFAAATAPASRPRPAGLRRPRRRR